MHTCIGVAGRPSVSRHRAVYSCVNAYLYRSRPSVSRHRAVYSCVNAYLYRSRPSVSRHRAIYSCVNAYLYRSRPSVSRHRAIYSCVNAYLCRSRRPPVSQSVSWCLSGRGRRRASAAVVRDCLHCGECKHTGSWDRRGRRLVEN